jgi:hypothetical protein
LVRRVIGDHDPAPLATGAVLVHIGPPKTGSTTVQSALYAARSRLTAQGVHHAGGSRHPAAAVQAVTGRPSQYSGGVVPSEWRWRWLVREVRQATSPRVILSSELLADATPDRVQRIVTDLGGPRVHVVVTLRSLARILPSQWQQFVQDGSRAAFDRWLERVLRDGHDAPDRTFWMRHRHDQLIRRWADVVGTDRVTAVVIDEHDHEMVLRVFEHLLGLEPRTLRAEDNLSNRSLTVPEVEAVRAFNRDFRARELPPALLSRTMHYGAGRYLKSRPPHPGAARVRLPSWAAEPTSAIAAEITAGVQASGVRVIGDLASLRDIGEVASPDDGVPAARVPPEIAATMAMGVLVSTGVARSSTAPEPAELQQIPTYQLAGFLTRRLRAAGGRRWRRAIRSLRRGQG